MTVASCLRGTGLAGGSAPSVAEVMERDGSESGASPLTSWLAHLGNPALCAAFLTGFLILFAFIGTFTYVNFVLVGPPFSVGMMMLGTVYFVFLPSVITTPLAGRVVARCGTRPTLWASFAVAIAGLPLLLSSAFAIVLTGLALVAVGVVLGRQAAVGLLQLGFTGAALDPQDLVIITFCHSCAALSDS